MSTSPMFKDLLIVALKGAGMGAANVIPGVSGGTIAFITGIYERLLNALKSSVRTPPSSSSGATSPASPKRSISHFSSLSGSGSL